jgi:Protein of unknown function (DUF1513)
MPLSVSQLRGSALLSAEVLMSRSTRIRSLALATALHGCCWFEDPPATDSGVVDTGDSGTAVPVVEADCDGIDDDLNGVVDDGAAAGWLTDPDRWELVATLDAGFNGSAGLDLIEGPGGDGVYVTAAEWNADYWNDALVVYHLAEDGAVAEVDRLATDSDAYVLHAAAGPDGRIWFAAETTVSEFAVESEPLVARFDPSDASWQKVLEDDPGSVAIEIGNVVPDADGAWFSYSSVDAAQEDWWATGRIDHNDAFTLVDTWTLSGRPASFDSPWLSALDPDGVLWSVGSAEDENDLTHGVIRAGVGDSSVVMLDTHLHLEEDWYEGYTDIAFDGVGRWFAAHNSLDVVTGDRLDWRVVQGERGLPGTWSLWDEVATAGAWTLALHPSGMVFVGGTVNDAGQRKSFLRAGAAASGFVTVVKGEPAAGRDQWIWDVFVDADGVVWAIEGDGPLAFDAPSELRVLRLSCR